MAKRKKVEKDLPIGRITDVGLEFTRPDGSVIIFTSMEYEQRQADRRLEIKTHIPHYYNRFGE